MKIFSFWEENWRKLLWSLEILLIFPNFLISYLSSCLITRELSPTYHVSWVISCMPCIVRYLLHTMYREISPRYHVSWGISYIPCIVRCFLHTMYRELSPTYHVSWGISYIPCLLLKITLWFICGERKIWPHIKKSQKIIAMIVEYEENLLSFKNYEAWKRWQIFLIIMFWFWCLWFNSLWINITRSQQGLVLTKKILGSRLKRDF